MEAAAQDRAGRRRVFCGLCSTGSDDTQVKSNALVAAKENCFKNRFKLTPLG